MMFHFIFFFVVLNPQIVSSFSWHPKQDSRLLTITQQGLLRDLIVQEHIPFVSICLSDHIVQEHIPFISFCLMDLIVQKHIPFVSI